MRKDTRHLKESVNRLTDEHLSYFLGVLEALYFAQNAKEGENNDEQKNLVGNAGIDTLPQNDKRPMRV